MNKENLLKIIDDLCKARQITRNVAFIESGVGNNFATNLKKCDASDGKLAQLAIYFGVSVAYLKGEEPDSDPIQLDDSRVGIMKKLNTLTPDQVKAAEQYIDFLASQTQNQ